MHIKKSLYIFIFGLIILNIYLFVKNISGSGVTQNAILREETNTNPSIKIYKFDTDFWREDDMFQYVLDKYEITQIPVLLKINETTYEKFVIDNEKMTGDDYQNYLKKFISK